MWGRDYHLFHPLPCCRSFTSSVMAEGTTGDKSFSMKMTIYGIGKKFPSVRNVSCEQLEKWRSDQQSKLVILDTRPIEEYRVSHLLGAIQVDPQEEPSLETLGITPESRIVCYCSVGYRSSMVAQKLFSQHKRRATGSDVDTQQGIGTNDHKASKLDSSKLDIYNLEGGIFQWVCEQREIVNNKGERVNTVHPYSSIWGKLLPVNLRHKF